VELREGVKWYVKDLLALLTVLGCYKPARGCEDSVTNGESS
jgi:hypothetical protein